MAIAFSKYINISSGVGVGALVATRDLIARIFTINELVPPHSYLEFTSAADVGVYFGTSSEEYLRAAVYFSWVSKNITRPQKISFARWVNADTAPKIFGARFDTTLAEFKAVTTGAFSLTLGATTNVISGLDFSGAANLAAIATIIETAINDETGTQWTAATVTYDATRGAFNFVGGDDVAAVVSVQAPGSGTDISILMGWRPEGVLGAIWSDGSLLQTITDLLTESADASDNFGSFLFIPSLSLDEITEAAIWTDGQNVKFIYLVPVSAANAETYSDALIDYSGVGVTKESDEEYPEQLPSQIFAATDYTQVYSTQNFMYQQAVLTPSVTTTTESDALDALRINYYGRTQTAGQDVSFYQRGLLMGLPIAPTDMNTFANEIWLKDAIGAALMTLFLALSKISANTNGRAQILTVITSIITRALNNGTISVGKSLTVIQQLYITEITGDSRAWYQVQNQGYWVDAVIAPVTNDSGAVEYKASYILVYSKDDTIRQIISRDILI